MAQLAAQGKLEVGDEFIHESIIGSLFNGRVERAAKVGNHDAIVPSVEGWARITGYNTIFIDDRDPYAHGFPARLVPGINPAPSSPSSSLQNDP